MDRQDCYKENINNILIKEKRYRDPNFSASKLAEMLGVSPFKLSRIIKSEYDMSYSDIVCTYRIQDAMRYLMDKRFVPYSIDDIGMIVGFRNRQSFFTAFKKMSGTTPDKYRNK